MESLLSYIITLFYSSLSADYGIQMDEISNSFYSAIKGINIGVAAFQLVLSLAICFFGYKLLKILITIDGALTGLVSGIVVGVFLLASGIGREPWIILVLALGLMLLFGFLAFKLYRLGIFLHYFICGTLVFSVILALFRVQNFWVIIGISAGVGIIIGILALIFNKMYIIISSAIIGGLCAGEAIGVLVETNKDGVKILIGLIIAIIGAIFQFWYENKGFNKGKGINNNTSGDFITSTREKMGAKVFCTKCGAQSDVGTRFCSVCGNSLYSASQSSGGHEEELVIPTNIVFTGNEDKGALKTRMNDALEDGRWGEAILFAERVINTDAEDGDGYLGALLAECGISNVELIAQKGDVISGSKYYKGLIKYGDSELIEKVQLNENKAKALRKSKTVEILHALADGLLILKDRQSEEQIIESSLKEKRKISTKQLLINMLGIIMSIQFVEMVVFHLLGIINYNYFGNIYSYGSGFDVNARDFNFARMFFDPGMWVAVLGSKLRTPKLLYTILYYFVLISWGLVFVRRIKRKKEKNVEVDKKQSKYRSLVEEEQKIISSMAPFLAYIPVGLRNDTAIKNVLEEYQNRNHGNDNSVDKDENEDIISIIEKFHGDIEKVNNKIKTIPYEGIENLSSKYDALPELQSIIDSMRNARLNYNDEEKRKMNGQSSNIAYSNQKCRVCGALLENGASFCIKCGTKVVEEFQPKITTLSKEESGAYFFCSSCGTRLSVGTKFCTKCGAKT